MAFTNPFQVHKQKNVAWGGGASAYDGNTRENTNDEIITKVINVNSSTAGYVKNSNKGTLTYGNSIITSDIPDSFVKNTGDTMTGDLIMDFGDQIWTELIQEVTSGAGIELRTNSADDTSIEITNIGTGVCALNADGNIKTEATFRGNNWQTTGTLSDMDVNVLRTDQDSIFNIRNSDASFVAHLQIDGNLGIGVAPTTTDIIKAQKTMSGTGVNTGAIIELTQSAANANAIAAVNSGLYTTHTSGTMTNSIGYFGGCKPNSNSAITLGYGVYGVTEIQNTKTSALTVAAGVVGGIDIEDGSTTYGISLYGLGPAVDTGTLTNAMTCYLAAATGGSTTWGLMSEDDVPVNFGKKLLLEGALG